MHKDRLALLFVDDQPVLSSLQFALTLQGFMPEDGDAEGASVWAASCLIIDQRYGPGGLNFLQELRVAGIGVPAILLVTNPTERLRRCAASRGAVVIEKPLLGDELAETLHIILDHSKAA
ncbi:histidine kinase [Sphingobium sp. SCG-1]|uniref:histidine kinase n=1 Tax=Sphingobium sp. SCG-1 TaxID=2072936 RepID=UPI000CD6BB98|nr:histidine kinase [Sphingobium sp. SCG-1]AUW59320.1 histidine kinase [Sphingobium sp. SCG-1]